MTRRSFLVSVSCAVPAAAGKGEGFPSERRRYPDPATEFEVLRLTDPAHSSYLPGRYARAIPRNDEFLLFAGDRSGSLQAFRLDLKNGQTKQLTDAQNLDRSSLTLLPDGRSFYYLDGRSVRQM